MKYSVILGTGWVSNLALTRLKSAIYPLYRQPLLSELSGGALETFAHPPQESLQQPRRLRQRQEAL
jgi:hypothetical protein